METASPTAVVGTGTVSLPPLVEVEVEVEVEVVVVVAGP